MLDKTKQPFTLDSATNNLIVNNNNVIVTIIVHVNHMLLNNCYEVPSHSIRIPTGHAVKHYVYTALRRATKEWYHKITLMLNRVSHDIEHDLLINGIIDSNSIVGSINTAEYSGINYDGMPANIVNYRYFENNIFIEITID